MDALPAGEPRIAGRRDRAALVGRLRLAAGLVLFTYVATHLANHALGLVSLAAMEAGRQWFLAAWRNPVGTTLLYGAFFTHLALVLLAIWRRRTLRIPAGELVRLGLGLAIPFLVVSHVVSNRVAHAWYGVEDSYTRVVYGLWHARPDLGLRQAILVLVVWTHGVMGLHFWLRFRRWYPSAAPVLLAGGVLLPALALLGFSQAAREVGVLAREAGWVERLPRATAAQRAALDALIEVILWGLAALIAGVFGGRIARDAWGRRRRGLIRVRHADLTEGPRVPVGTSVLEASRIAGIPHASVCGGRGRCSTCRVRVLGELNRLPAASEGELRVLRRVAAPPNVRLACQLRPTHDVLVVRLLPPALRPADAQPSVVPIAGQEQDVAVFFADLRGFTRLAEHRLPYDVVFILNRYFEAVGQAIEESGGITNQFTGDGVMALFGVGMPAAEGCRRALGAARAVVDALARLSEALAGEIEAPLRLGIGIHAGAAVVGEMGYGAAVYLTAVGDTVHVASRLQDLTKQYACQLVISEHVAVVAGLDVEAFPRHEITVRNRREPLAIRVIDDARRLAVTPEGVRAAGAQP